MSTKLRVGILLDTVVMPAWAFAAIERMVHSNSAELVLVILNKSQPIEDFVLRTPQPEPAHRLYQMFNRLDEKLFIHGPNALTPVDASEIFSKVPVVEVEPFDENGKQKFSDAAIEQIKSHQPDILVKMGFGNLRGQILSVARYGVWAYRWGDHRKIEDGLTGFWETAKRWPEIGAALQVLGTDSKQNRILFESWFFTYPYSPARSRNYVLWAAASFLPRQIERIHKLGGERYFQDLKNTTAEKPTALKSNRIPANLAVLWIMIRLAFRNLVEVYQRKFYREQWELRFSFGSRIEKDLSAFKKISPPKDCFWADPHVIYKEPKYYVFIEEYPYQTKRGHISVIEMDRTGNYKQPIPVLQKDCHLSFPFVFHWMGRYYMIPESSEKRTIDLYECINFPNQWQHAMMLMKDVKAVDTTVFYMQGKWWLFTAMAEQEAAAPQVELFLFYSDDLFTDHWQAHPLNPIVSDVKRARGAGSIFLRNGKLFRPSQDCSKAYGYGFDLNEIVCLSETEYCERTVTSVRPNSNNKIIATHTYANQGNLTVIDALTRRPKWAKTA